MKSSSPSKTKRLCANGENSKEIMGMKYNEIISTLPKRETPYPPYELCQYQGFWFPFIFLQGIIFLPEIFKAHEPSDIFLCSYPKSGTTWLKALAFSIMTRDHFFDNDSTNPLLNKLLHEFIPAMEVDYVNNPSLLDTELPLLATHLPYPLLPPSILESDCKIIYICREPKDTFVSLWHFSQRSRENMAE
uniref:Sulfotransferase n=1 Tax=Nicotiana sylvestris TaxID=4096 RepID=A0A1U7X6M3_NICSY